MKKHDSIEHPDHYILDDGTEVIDIIRSAGYLEDYAKGNILKYTFRAGRKDGVSAEEDMLKVARYATVLAEYYGR